MHSAGLSWLQLQGKAFQAPKKIKNQVTCELRKVIVCTTIIMGKALRGNVAHQETGVWAPVPQAEV